MHKCPAEPSAGHFLSSPLHLRERTLCSKSRRVFSVLRLLGDLEGAGHGSCKIVTVDGDDGHDIASGSVGAVVVLEYGFHLLVKPLYR